MRISAKIACGFGAAALIYFLVDLLFLSSRHVAPKQALQSSGSVTTQEKNVSLLERQVAQGEEIPRPITQRRSAPMAGASAPPPPAARAEPSRTNELTATLEAQYAVDSRPTRESVRKERALENLFSQPELDGKGRLEEVNCRGTICRGVVKMANELNDSEVFSRTLLSGEFMSVIQDAVSVASRERQSDGSVIATFYTHPQSIFETVDH